MPRHPLKEWIAIGYVERFKALCMANAAFHIWFERVTQHANKHCMYICCMERRGMCMHCVCVSCRSCLAPIIIIDHIAGEEDYSVRARVGGMSWQYINLPAVHTHLLWDGLQTRAMIPIWSADRTKIDRCDAKSDMHDEFGASSRIIKLPLEHASS